MELCVEFINEIVEFEESFSVLTSDEILIWVFLRLLKLLLKETELMWKGYFISFGLVSLKFF